MPETETPTTELQTENKAETPKIASTGTVQRVKVNLAKEAEEVIAEANNIDSNTVVENDDTNSLVSKEGANATPKANESVAGEKPDTPATQAPEFTEEHFKKFLKDHNIDVDSIDSLKEKLTPKAELTEAQKTEQAKAIDKKRVDLFVAGGGKVEDYVAIKNIAEGDLKELSVSALKKELKDQKFSEEEIQQIIKERYYQIDEEDLEQYEDESEKDFLKRKKEYGANKLATRSSHTQKQAQAILKELNDAIESENLQKQEEVATSAKIDDYFKAAPRKLTFEIGEANGKKIAPVEYEVADSDLAEVQSVLKNPDKRNKFLYNEDGSLNLTNIADVLTRNKYLESAVKLAYFEGVDRNTQEIRKTFGSSNPHELGIGGAAERVSNGRVASSGKPQRIRPQHN